MKKLLVAFAAIVAFTVTIQAQQFRAQSFLGVPSITVSNGASAPLGGFTNVASSINVGGTNALNFTWTNNLGIWVIVTNNTPGTTSGISYVTNDATQVAIDIPLWANRNGGPTSLVVSNDGLTYLSPMNISAKVLGQTGASGGTLNLIFVGVPDGNNEITGTAPTFQWGISTTASSSVVYTNFPMWKFEGCSKLRLRSATLTTTAAATDQQTITALTLNGFPP